MRGWNTGGGGRARRDDGSAGHWHRHRHNPVIWAEDQASFRIECEGDGLTDSRVSEWLVRLRKEIKWQKKVVCSSLNLSRNELGDAGVAEIMRFLVAEGVPVLLMKLYKNWISDEGMTAIGDFIRQSPEPAVQEIHLSHNYVTEEGALAVFKAVMDSKRYPCHRGKEGSPLWLRLENNSVDWEPVTQKLSTWEISWAIGDTRDSWRKDSGAVCPMVAMHRSYHHQTPRAAGGSSGSGAGGVNGRQGRSLGERPQRQEDAGSESSGGGGGGGHGRRHGSQRWVPREEPDQHHQSNDTQSGSEEQHRGSRYTATSAVDDDSRGDDWRPVRNAASGIVPTNRDNPEDEMKRFVDSLLHDVAKVQQDKFSLIFSILSELQEKQLSLENSMQELLQHQRQHHQQQQQLHQQQQQQQRQHQQLHHAPHQVATYGNVVQMMPEEGQQQNWSVDDQHQFGRGVW